MAAAAPTVAAAPYGGPWEAVVRVRDECAGLVRSVVDAAGFGLRALVASGRPFVAGRGHLVRPPLRRNDSAQGSASLLPPAHPTPPGDAFAELRSVHSRCAPPSRAVWRRAGVFAGAFTERAAVSVCQDDGLSARQVAEALVRLAALGVLVPQDDPGAGGQPRYLMPRAARAFGQTRLAAAGETDAARDRHGRHCHGVAVAAEALWSAGLQRDAARLVREEREALAAFLGAVPRRPADAEAAMETALALWFWWAAHDRAPEGASHVLALLPRLPSDSPLRVRGQWLAGWLLAAADPGTAGRLLGLAWPAAVLAGDDALVGRIAHAQGTLAWRRGDPAAAEAHYRSAAETIPDHAPAGPSPVVSLAALAVVQARTSPARAARTARRALARTAAHHDAWAAALAHCALAHAEHHAGDTPRARHRARRALARLDTPLDPPHARAALDDLLRHTAPRAGGRTD
ncbi:hypothetical protein [Streptomyces filamentosus]|uniref:hypothetical protein n=1 Tax=Streptomyces filamentosus TaxID=67294 RepID=UPI0037D2B338